MFSNEAHGDGARGKFVSGANHMRSNEAVPTIWDPDLKFFVGSEKTYLKSIFGKSSPWNGFEPGTP